MRLINLLILVFAAFFLFSSCQDDPTSLGKELIGDELEIQIYDSEEAGINQSSSSFSADSLTFGSSARLVLGHVENRKSTMLLRFGVILPDSIRTSIENDSLTILSATAFLKPIYRIGDEGQLIDFTVHEITSNWGSNNFNSDSLAMLTYETMELTDSKTITDSLIQFDVHTDVAYNWLEALISDTLANNYGMIFIPNESVNKAYGFRAFPFTSTSDAPRLRYIVENEDAKIDTINAQVVFDVHLVEGTVDDPGSNRFQLTSGLGQRGKLYFDLSDLPRYANINRAELTLTTDSLSSLIGRPDVDSLRLRLLSDSTSLELNSDYSIRRITFDGSEFSGDIAPLIQGILHGADNQGFQLVLGNEDESLDRYVIYGSNYTDPALRPKLKIYYTVNR